MKIESGMTVDEVVFLLLKQDAAGLKRAIKKNPFGANEEDKKDLKALKRVIEYYGG